MTPSIIAVGYRINTKRATAFRQWATTVLRDFALRGYVIDRKRMGNGAFLDEDYFEHILAKIRYALYKKLSLPLDLLIAKKSVFERRSKALILESAIAKQGVRIYGK